jgi:hypothetical protein
MTERPVWVLEADVFADCHRGLRDAVTAADGEVVLWRDDWLVDDSWPRLAGKTVVFHGSLGNAALVAERLPWSPGAFCDTERFRRSSWYPAAATGVH